MDSFSDESGEYEEMSDYFTDDSDDEDMSDGSHDDDFWGVDGCSNCIDHEFLQYKIKHDDPDLTTLKVAGPEGYRSPGHDWEGDGKSLGRNTNVRELSFDSCLWTGVSQEKFEAFLDGVSCNRSIRELMFNNMGNFFLEAKVLSTLTPFFINNTSFESLKIHGCTFGSTGLRLLATALTQFDTLKEFELFMCMPEQLGDKIDDDGAYIKALVGHSGLRKLNISENRFVQNFDSLVPLLQNPKSKLAVLKLERMGLGDNEAAVLVAGLSGNSTLEALVLDCNFDITEDGWAAIFAVLESSSFRLQKLSLNGTKINNAAAFSLANALNINSCLRSLTLSQYGYSLSINDLSRGWGVLIKSFQSPGCELEDLSLNLHDPTDDVILCVSNSLAKNSSLKSLDLAMPRLQALSTVLRSPDSALEKLNLYVRGDNVEGAISFVNSIVDNGRLKELEISGILPTPSCWTAFSHVLCDGSSIVATYHSNHTLERVSWSDERLPKNIRSLLKLNRDKSKSEAARFKITRHHFSKGFNAEPFFDMEWKITPYAIAWIGKLHIRGSQINEYIFEFLRNNYVMVS